MQAYHMIGLDGADFFRLQAGKIPLEEIIHKGQTLFNSITAEGKLSPSAVRAGAQTRQFHLDRLAGDDQYVYLSIGRRYWNEPPSANFGFVFDAEQLLRQQGAILRTKDLLSDYGDLLDEVVRRFIPDRREEEFSEAEVERLMTALEDPESDYVSPNDAYYTLMDAVEHQKLDVPQCQEATAAFIERVQAYQQEHQFTGEEAIRRAQAEGETGCFELLVKGSLCLSLCVSVVFGDKNAQAMQ